jgi:hypothetical protein
MQDRNQEAKGGALYEEIKQELAKSNSLENNTDKAQAASGVEPELEVAPKIVLDETNTSTEIKGAAPFTAAEQDIAKLAANIALDEMALPEVPERSQREMAQKSASDQ